MITIRDKKDFEELIHTQEFVICFVHSSWAEQSMMGRQRFMELTLSKSDFSFVLIDNGSTESFVYDWLEDQEKTFGMNNNKLRKGKGSWIHGNGELFGVRNKQLIWFESSIHNHTFSEMEEKNYFKM